MDQRMKVNPFDRYGKTAVREGDACHACVPFIANDAVSRSPAGLVQLGSNWRAISPKIHELKTRYEANLAMQLNSL